MSVFISDKNTAKLYIQFFFWSIERNEIAPGTSEATSVLEYTTQKLIQGTYLVKKALKISTNFKSSKNN